MSKPKSLIQFSKMQIRSAINYQIEAIAELANIEPIPKCFNNMNVVLAILRKIEKDAPDIPNLPPEMAEKS